MPGLGETLTSVRSSDADTRRRGRMLIIIAFGVAILALAFIPVVLVTSRSAFALLTLVVGAVAFAGVVLLGRAGRVDLGAYILLGSCLLAITLSIPATGQTTNTPFFMVLPVIFAGILLPPAQIWGALTLAVLGIAAGAGLLPPEVRSTPAWRQALSSAPLMLIVVAMVSFLGSRGIARALAEAEAAREEAEEAGRSLAASNVQLEARVEERTAALRQIADEQRAVAGQLAASLEAQRDLNRVVAELSVPILPISAGTLVVPLVGNIDSARAELLLSAVLAQVEASGARTVVLDVTGVALVDTQVAGALLRVGAAANLMGADTILVGIRPEVAQALVHLGVDLISLRTAATLQAGLAMTGVVLQR